MKKSRGLSKIESKTKNAAAGTHRTAKHKIISLKKMIEFTKSNKAREYFENRLTLWSKK